MIDEPAGGGKSDGAGFWAASLLGAFLAFLLYAPVSGHPFSVPDLDIIVNSPQAAKLMPMSRIWGEAMPSERPDLGAYRPIHGLLLRAQYEWWPARARSFHELSIALIACLAAGVGALAARGLRTGPARMAAVAVFACHPFLAQSVNLASDQNALLAGLAWTLALLVYWRAAEGRLRAWIAAPALAGLYFVAAGAHEAGFLLPLALIAVEFLRREGEAIGATAFDAACEPAEADEPKSRKRTKTKGAAATRSARAGNAAAEFDANNISEAADEGGATARGLGRQGRMFAFGLPMMAVASILFYLRVSALGGALGATGAGQIFFDESAVGRVVKSLAAVGIAIERMILVSRGPSVFYPVRYHGELLLMGWVCFAAVGGATALLLLKPALRRGPLGLGWALMLVPALGLIQVVPQSTFFSESLVPFMAPGAALFLGGLIELLVGRLREAEARSAARRVPGARARLLKLVPAAIVLGLVLIAFTSRRRTGLWADSVALWRAEAARWPKASQPLATQLIQQVSRGARGLEMKAAEAKAEAALALARPPDTDPAHQYLALGYDALNDAAKLGPALDRALAAPGPHIAGYGSTLGLIAARRQFLDKAERGYALELERDPENFDATLGLAELRLAQGKAKEALDLATAAARVAPSTGSSIAYLRVGQAAIKLGPSEENFRLADRALHRAISLDPMLVDAYLDLAKLYVRAGNYRLADQTLAEARGRMKLDSYLPLYRVQIDALERQGRQAAVYDMLGETMRRYPADAATAYFAADYLLRHEQWRDARGVATKLAQSDPRNPALLYVLANTGVELKMNDKESATNLWQSLMLNPTDPRALELLAAMEQRGIKTPRQVQDQIARGKAAASGSPAAPAAATPGAAPAKAVQTPAPAVPPSAPPLPPATTSAATPASP